MRRRARKVCARASVTQIVELEQRLVLTFPVLIRRLHLVVDRRKGGGAWHGLLLK